MGYIIAIELPFAVQALESWISEKLGKATKVVYSTIRQAASMLKEDRVLSENRKNHKNNKKA